jgi:starvation-inducible DNA-binding protein
VTTSASQHSKSLRPRPHRERHTPGDVITATVLNDVLAHTLDLGLQARQAHWNLSGPQSGAIHDTLARFVRDLDELSDAVAERVVQLGGTAEGTIRSLHDRSTLNPYPTTLEAGAHLPTLVAAVNATVITLRHALSDVPPGDEPVTLDILTEALRIVEKWLWYLEAHLEPA